MAPLGARGQEIWRTAGMLGELLLPRQRRGDGDLDTYITFGSEYLGQGVPLGLPCRQWAGMDAFFLDDFFLKPIIHSMKYVDFHQ